MDVHLALAEGLKELPVEDPAGVLLSSGIQAPTWDEAWAAAVELATSWAWEEAKETTPPDQRDQRELVMDHMQMMQSLPPPKPKKAPWRTEFQ